MADIPEKKPEEKEKTDVYQAFKSIPEKYRPKLDEQNNRLIFQSPFDEYPGTVSTVYRLSALDYDKFWKSSYDGQPEDDHRHWAAYIWETRFHLSKNWSLKNIESSQITDDALLLPDNRIAIWYAAITQPVIELATSLPNWPSPSSPF